MNLLLLDLIGQTKNCSCLSIYCHALSCISAACAVMQSVTFVYCIKMYEHIFKFFSPLGVHIIPVTKRYDNIPTGIPLTLSAGGLGTNHDSRPLSGFIMWCQRFDRQVLYTQLHWTVASWWHSSIVSGVVCCSQQDGQRSVYYKSAAYSI